MTNYLSHFVDGVSVRRAPHEKQPAGLCCSDFQLNFSCDSQVFSPSLSFVLRCNISGDSVKLMRLDNSSIEVQVILCYHYGRR